MAFIMIFILLSSPVLGLVTNDRMDVQTWTPTHVYHALDMGNAVVCREPHEKAATRMRMQRHMPGNWVDVHQSRPVPKSKLATAH